MATTQQAIDTKYDYYLALRDEKLKSLFSPEILGWARQNGLNTFDDIVNYNGGLNLSGIGLSTVSGLNYFKEISEITLNCVLT